MSSTRTVKKMTSETALATELAAHLSSHRSEMLDVYNFDELAAFDMSGSAGQSAQKSLKRGPP